MNNYKETHKSSVTKVILGATGKEGGTRQCSLEIGGDRAMPFYTFDEKNINPPLIAFEITVKKPSEWADELEKIWGDVWHDPVLWAKKCTEKYGVKAICINLISAKPDEGAVSFAECSNAAKAVAQNTAVPIIVKGTGIAHIDNELLPLVSEALKGERVLIGPVLQENYKTIMNSAIKNGHLLIAESPIDINIAKQLNIMLADNEFPEDRIVMDPTTGALGYGLEYSYSIMERARIAALGGDKSLAAPFINFVGIESWRSGEGRKVGFLWEAVTALSFLQAGSNIVVMRHPQAAEKVHLTVSKMIAGDNEK